MSYTTIAHFNEHLKPTMTDIELLRLFSLAEEFRWVLAGSPRRKGPGCKGRGLWPRSLVMRSSTPNVPQVYTRIPAVST